MREVSRRRILVLEIRYGGLGDHLFYSHLPRLAKQLRKYDKVYISTRSEFRYPDIRSLLWETNPYIDGFVDEPGAHTTIGILSYYAEFTRVRAGHNLMDEFMRFYGLDDGKRFHEPEVYFTPSVRPEYAGKVVYDPNYWTNAGEGITGEMVRAFFLREGARIDLQMALRRKHVEVAGAGQWLTLPDLRHFADLLYSCKKYYCFASGGATLSAALHKPATVFYYGGLRRQDWKRIYLHSRINRYVPLQ